MNIESTIKNLVKDYNLKYSSHPIVIFDFVSLDSKTNGKLVWRTYHVSSVYEKYKKFVEDFIGVNKKPEDIQTLLKTEYDRDAFLYQELGDNMLCNDYLNSQYRYTEEPDPVKIEALVHKNIKNDRELIEDYIDRLKNKFSAGSTMWISMPHTDNTGSKIYSAIFVLFNSKIDYGEDQIAKSKLVRLDAYRTFRDFIVTYLIELYKAPLAEEIIKTKKSLAYLKKSNSNIIQKWIEENPEFYMGDIIRQRIEQMLSAIQSDIPILIIGETGTGKEHIARSIHQLSRRYDANKSIDSQYYPLNCSGYEEGDDLVSSELFGHEKGSYTGATGPRKGLLETYTNGTIFLDEIQQMPISVQKKLKRVMDGFFSKEKEATYRSRGGDVEKKTKVRFIFATNQNIIDLVQCGKFLDDFFYRINIITITIPPLRERKEEILMLAEKFLTEENTSNGYTKNLTEDAKKKLQSYSFPGNVRELRSILLRAYFLSGATSNIRDTDLHFDGILKHQYSVLLTKPNGLSNETVFRTVCDLYEANEKLNAEGTNIKNAVLVKALPNDPYGYRNSPDASAERAFKSKWLNSKHKADLQKIITANKDSFPALENLRFVRSVLSSKQKVKKSKKE